MSELNSVDTALLEIIANMKNGKAEGAVNIRKDSGCTHNKKYNFSLLSTITLQHSSEFSFSLHEKTLGNGKAFVLYTKVVVFEIEDILN